MTEHSGKTLVLRDSVLCIRPVGWRYFSRPRFACLTCILQVKGEREVTRRGFHPSEAAEPGCRSRYLCPSSPHSTDAWLRSSPSGIPWFPLKDTQNTAKTLQRSPTHKSLRIPSASQPLSSSFITCLACEPCHCSAAEPSGVLGPGATPKGRSQTSSRMEGAGGGKATIYRGS